MFKRTLAIQLSLIAVCIFVLVEFGVNFPYPSPLIRPLLPPPKRWPTLQVEHWVETQDFDSGFLEFFARDPDRTIPRGDNLVSPADGLVQSITFRDGITYLVIGLSFWDVHVVRAPAAGIVKDVAAEGVTYWRDGSKTALRESIFLRGKAAPVQQIVTIKGAGIAMKVRLITSYWASRLKVWVHDGEPLGKGQRIGRILLGSTVVLELPRRISLTVRPGQRVVAGETIIYRGGLR